MDIWNDGNWLKVDHLARRVVLCANRRNASPLRFFLDDEDNTAYHRTKVFLDWQLVTELQQ